MCLLGWFLPEILRLIIPNDEKQCEISTFTRSGKEILDKQIDDIRKIFFFNHYYGIPTDKNYFYPTKDYSVVTDDEVHDRFPEVDGDLKYVLQSYINLNDRYYAFYDTPILIGLCLECFDCLFLDDDCDFSLNDKLPNNLYHCQDCIDDDKKTRVDWKTIEKMDGLISDKYTPRKVIDTETLFKLIHKLE